MQGIHVSAILAVFFLGSFSGQLSAAKEAAERSARPAQCFLEVNGVHYMGGNCSFTPVGKNGSFRIKTSKGLSASVTVTENLIGDAVWNDAHGVSAKTVILGVAYGDGKGCWSNFDPDDQTKEFHLCAWDKTERLYLGPTPVEQPPPQASPGASVPECMRG